MTKQDSEGFTRFLYQGPDMLKLLQERDTNGGLIAHYTMGQGLEAMRRGTASHFYHFDWLGSTFELTDASGVVTDDYLYNAWGEVLSRTGTTSNPHGYVGNRRYYQSETAFLYHVGHRRLMESLGRFLSSDPVRDGMNLYIYVNNSATTWVDPMGLWGPDVHQDLTEYWAKMTTGVGRLSRTGSMLTKQIGMYLAGDLGTFDNLVDTTPQTWPLSPDGWKWHFDWPPGSRSREMLFNQQWREALAWGVKGAGEDHCCRKAAQALGRGLHPLQDIRAHRSLGPHGHMDRRNYQYADDQGYTPLGYPNEVAQRSPFEITGKFKYYVIPEKVIRAGVSEPELISTPIYQWQAGGRRINDTEWETKYYVSKFLELTYCGEKL